MTRRLAPRAALALALLTVAAAAAGLSAASMSDHVQGLPSALAGGTLKLGTDHAGVAVLEAANLRPGLHRSETIELRNDGSVDAEVSVHQSGLDDAPAAAGLSAVLGLTVEDCGADAGCAAPRVAYDGSLAHFDATPLGALPAGGHRFVRLTVAWGATKDDPSRQGATTRSTLTWTAVAGASA